MSMRDREEVKRIYAGLPKVRVSPSKKEAMALIHQGRDRMGYFRYDDETTAKLAAILLSEEVETWESILTFHEAAATGQVRHE